MRLNERHLMQLAAVLDAGGVSEGAALLGMTQPAVSRSLSELEARVGQPLFVKGRRPPQPTQLARQLALQGRAMIAASRRASETLQGYLNGSTGLVRVGGVPYFMDALVSGMIAQFQNTEPEIAIEQSYGNLPELMASLSSGQIDLAIAPVGSMDMGSEISFTPILPGRNVVACRQGHPLTRRGELRAADLALYPWVAPLPGSPLMSDLQIILVSIGTDGLSIRYAGGSLLSVVNYMMETDALTVMPFSVTFALRHQNSVAVLPYDIHQPTRTLGILRRTVKGNELAATRRFISFVRGTFEDMKQVIVQHERAVIWQRETHA